MSGHRRAVAVLLGVACVAVGLAAPAQADTNDDRFAEIVAGLGIPVDPETLPATGRRICDMLTTGLVDAVNPVPVVRGVRDMLQQSNGLERRQASGLLKAAASVYCPENLAYLGR